jgi:hypothetical protein
MEEFAAAVTFTWFGMVLAISFVEAPLKFRAPGITVPLGLGIGRLVFRALNVLEIVAALAVALALLQGEATAGIWIAACMVGVCLAVQIAVLRPVLDRRAAAIIAGQQMPRSRLHVVYIVLEAVKVLTLPVLGFLWLT